MHIEGFEGFDKKLDFNRSKVRAGMRKAGRLVAGQAKMNLSLARGSDGYPAVKTGALRDSVDFKLSRSGFLVRIAPKKGEGMPAPYHAFLYYGVKAGARRRKDHKAQAGGGTWRIKPRKNYMVDALEDKAAEVEAILRKTYTNAIEIK
jgi:hypothetical protein